MKKTFLLLSMLFVSMPLAAQNSSLADINKRVDEISAPVMDIEARYWAGRVQSGSITIEEIEKNSKNWLGDVGHEYAIAHTFVGDNRTITLGNHRLYNTDL